MSDNGVVVALRQTTNVVKVDHFELLLLKMAELHNTKSMSDICLVVGRFEYQAHRLILSAYSEVFQVMLRESPESRVVLKETQGCMEIFGEFVKYFYTGKIEINMTNVIHLLVLAEKYKVKDLIAECIDYMCYRIALAASENQLVTWYQCTLSLGHHVTALACQDFLKINFETVAKGTDFGNCNREIVSRLLQWNGLVVTNELTLFHFIEGWLEYQEKTRLEEGVPLDVIESYLELLVHEVMSHVRFPMMSTRQLAELQLNPLIQKHKEFFVERMGIGMAFHNNQEEIIQQVLQDENGALMFTPRLYTSETFCSSITIDDFRRHAFTQTRTLFGSSPSGLAEHLGDEDSDWVVNFYPKGVWDPGSLYTLRNRDVTSVLKTVRVTIMYRTNTEAPVKLGLLVVGHRNGVEHTMKVVHRVHCFTKDYCLLHIDDVIPYDKLNEDHQQPSPFLIGPDSNTLKLHVVIVPLCKESHTLPQPKLLLSMR